MRWAWAEVDLDAVSHNVEVLRSMAEPAQVWAVVKSDAYGHGAIPVAQAAIAGGATGLCVALAQEGVELRNAGIDVPILVLSQQPPDELASLVANRLIPTVHSVDGVETLSAVVAASGIGRCGVHLKVDTGMHRSGALPRDAAPVATAIADSPNLDLAGVFTHLACADDPASAVNTLQLERFSEVLTSLRDAGHRPQLVHAANSAGSMAWPAARFDLVRPGIAIYGIEPGEGVSDLCVDLRPALTLRARVSVVRRVAAGEGVSYGWRHRFDSDTTVATVPIGYGDGVPRRLFETGGEVLVRGRRLPIAGVVTMDQLMVDCGDLDVEVGDEVVLIGSQSGPQGTQVVRAEEWAARLGTIGYEIVCAISKRIARLHVTSASPGSPARPVQ